MGRIKLAALALACSLAAVSGAGAVVPDAVGDTPILGAETTVGSISRTTVDSITPTAKTVDGSVGDWTGESTRLGGSAIYSHGEYVYQDYLMDDWGADDGYDAGRLDTLDQANAIEPRTYRVDALQQAGGDQFGAPQPIGAALNYGDANPGALKDQADIEEARVAADSSNLFFLVRTTGMTVVPGTAVLVLLDTEPGGSYPAPGLVSTKAEWAFLFAGNSVLSATHLGLPVSTTGIAAATDATGDVNAVEASVPFSTLGSLTGSIGVGIATGVVNAAGTGLMSTRTGDAQSDLINVAFRHEPARIWMDKDQALTLRHGTMDKFITSIDLGSLQTGRTETFQQGPGYYERVYEDATTLVKEEREDGSYYQGAFQHYGVYIPHAYRPDIPMPATYWFHYRGGHAHDAAAWEPGILRQFGDEVGGIVFTPSARGTSTWYTGRGMVDYQDMWADSHAHYNVDPSRVYLAGHSMGGWASYLMGLLMPDRWAASNPEDGLLAPGLWAGAGAPSDPQNNQDVNAEFLYPLLSNARNLPYAILHGTEDELVPSTSAIATGAQLHQLGQRYRVYLFHTYEHYSAPIWDDWRDVVAYMDTFRTAIDPAHVTYTVSPALDHAVSTHSVPANVDLHYHFDSAYWVSGLTTRTSDLDPNHTGTIDATTFGRGVEDTLGVPEAGTAAQPELYTMHGQRLVHTGWEPAANNFAVTLTNLGSATLDAVRMGLDTARAIGATVTTDGVTTLKILGGWATPPTVDGVTSSSYSSGVLTLTLASGAHTVSIVPTS